MLNNTKKINDILNDWFRFKQYSSYKVEVEEFENTLQDFGTFEVYDNFAHLLNDNEYLREDEEGELIPINDIMPSSLEGEKIFSDFLEDILNIDNFNRISLDDTREPIILGEALANHEVNKHLIRVSELEKNSDLLNFINDVLRDLGEVTHSTGTKNKYEVVEMLEVD